jgi:hypothetical protein
VQYASLLQMVSSSCDVECYFEMTPLLLRGRIQQLFLGYIEASQFSCLLTPGRGLAVTQVTGRVGMCGYVARLPLMSTPQMSGDGADDERVKRTDGLSGRKLGVSGDAVL